MSLRLFIIHTPHPIFANRYIFVISMPAPFPSYSAFIRHDVATDALGATDAAPTDLALNDLAVVSEEIQVRNSYRRT